MEAVSEAVAAAAYVTCRGSREPGPRAAPDWLKVRAPSGKRVEEVSGTLARFGLRTVCREARCPNVGECWGAGAATVILLGDVCTRGCAFCGVTAGVPAPPDPAEPGRVANAAAELAWRHVVVTSVTATTFPTAGRRTSHPSCAPCGGKRRGPRSNCSFRTSAETSMR